MKNCIKLIVIFGIFVSVFVGKSFATAGVSCVDFFSSRDIDVAKKVYNIKGLVSNFCTMVADYDCGYGEYFFDASQSVFLSILCNNVWQIWQYLPENQMTWDNAILKKSKFISFDIYDYIDEVTRQKSSINYCDYNESNMNNCDLSYFLPHIFDDIMNDFFNIRQASNMWISSVDDNFDKEKYANVYAVNHFPWLSNQNNMKDWLCASSYKETCKYLKNYMWQVRNLLTTTSVINVKNLWILWAKVDCLNDFDSNILYCGLLWEQKTQLYSLLKVVYNEYFWYNLFMSYYQYKLVSESISSIEWNKQDWNSNRKQDALNLENFRSLLWWYSSYENWTTEDISANLEKAYKSQEQVYRSKLAISEALRSLSRVEYSLPIHVWFLMYQEDVNLFMKSLPKIYTPLRTLYDKLQNVQDADS